MLAKPGPAITRLVMLRPQMPAVCLIAFAMLSFLVVDELDGRGAAATEEQNEASCIGVTGRVRGSVSVSATLQATLVDEATGKFRTCSTQQTVTHGGNRLMMSDVRSMVHT